MFYLPRIAYEDLAMNHLCHRPANILYAKCGMVFIIQRLGTTSVFSHGFSCLYLKFLKDSGVIKPKIIPRENNFTVKCCKNETQSVSNWEDFDRKCEYCI